jgi:hypothetical protein
MHSATTATGRPLPPPGKSLPKIRPALSIYRPLCPPQAHANLPPQKSYPEHTFIQNFRNCLNRNEKIFSNRNKTDVSAKYRFPQTSDDDSGKSPATEQARQSANGRFQAMTPRDQRDRTPTTSHQSRVANRSITLSARREGAINTHFLSNRHFSQVSGSTELQIADAHRQTHNVSNRQWQILENDVNLSKQTIVPRSNQHKNAILVSRLPGAPRSGPNGIESRDAFVRFRNGLATRVRAPRLTGHKIRNRVTNHYAPLTNHASPPLVIYSSHTPNPGSTCK